MSSDYGYLLVVDSSDTTHDALKSCLELRGFTVFGASSGGQALAMLRVQSYDLVLLGMSLPDQDGLEVLRQMKADASLQSIPVLMIASGVEPAKLDQSIELGAEDYISLSESNYLIGSRIHAYLQKTRLNPQWISPEKEVMLIKIERDLKIGHDIQADFLPKKLPPFDGWTIAYKYRPAREVGGDLYDVFSITDDGMISLIIGDVCDKGVGAALFMAVFRSLFRAAAQKQYSLHSRGIDISLSSNDFTEIATSVLKSAFDLVNNYVIDNHQEKGYFVTMFFGVLNPANGKLIYVNGGHVPVFLIGKEGVKQRLIASGPAVGLISNSPFEIQEVVIEPGDTLFTYTDGVTDARDPARKFFGESRLIELVSQPSASARELVERVDASLTKHIANAEQYDDITMLVVERAA